MGYTMEAPGYDLYGGLYDEDIAALVNALPLLRALDVAHIAEQQPAPNTGLCWQTVQGLGCTKVVAAASLLSACTQHPGKGCAP
jgi:hypothetical protein